MKNAYEESLDHLETLKRENKNLQRKSLALSSWQGFLALHHCPPLDMGLCLQFCKDAWSPWCGSALPIQL